MHTLDMPRIICDFETFSDLSVKDVGSWAYAEHPSTEILMMSYKAQGANKAGLWLPGEDFPQFIIDHINQGYPIEAHNCMFERAIWTTILFRQFSIPIPRRWIDTMASCAYRSVPLGLDKVGDALNLDVVKDKRGKVLLNKLSRPQKPTKKNPETRCRDPELMRELGEYCIQDSEAEDALGNTLGDLSRDEFSTWVMDQNINKRGVAVDLEAVEGALKIVNTITTRMEAELRKITGGACQSGGEVAKILKWVQDSGVAHMPNLQAGTIEDILKTSWFDNRPEVRRVLEIRQMLSRASAKKLIKFRDCTSNDGRLRVLLQYHGAGTGRWAGRGVQPQNFPRGAMDIKYKKIGVTPDEVMSMLIDCIKTGDPDLLELHFGDPMEAIASSLRGMFVAAPGTLFYVADFAAIEARVLMWLCGQMDAIQAFEQFDKGIGPDIYCVTAEKIYNRPINKDKDPAERQLGKITVLGCGYQMSGGKLKMQAEQSYKTLITDDQADLMVATFRENYTNVPQFWKDIERAAVNTVKYQNYHEIISENGVKIAFDYIKDAAGSWLVMILPNDRKIWYFSPGLEEKEITYVNKKTGETDTFTKNSVYYMGRNNKKGGAWSRVFTYGGMLTENAVQAIARDLMVAAMRRVEKTGVYKIVLTVHDELVAEANPAVGDIKEFEHIVAGPNPAWADGCPVAAEGWAGPRYRK